MSPILFSLYMEPLLKNLCDSRYGCKIGNITTNSFAYADDIVILSPTVSGLKALIKMCEKFSNDFNINFNSSKSNIISFNNDNNFVDFDFKINGITNTSY